MTCDEQLGQLERAAHLLREGVISDEEFAVFKARILSLSLDGPGSQQRLVGMDHEGEPKIELEEGSLEEADTDDQLSLEVTDEDVQLPEPEQGVAQVPGPQQLVAQQTASEGQPTKIVSQATKRQTAVDRNSPVLWWIGAFAAIFRIRGRIGRITFMLHQLISSAIVFYTVVVALEIINMPQYSAHSGQDENFGYAVLIVGTVVGIWMWYSAFVKRARDVDLEACNAIFWTWAPGINMLLILYLAAWPGVDGTNGYGRPEAGRPGPLVSTLVVAAYSVLFVYVLLWMLLVLLVLAAIKGLI